LKTFYGVQKKLMGNDELMTLEKRKNLKTNTENTTGGKNLP